jgi:pSer/pThr/pTyr-binding forkhead associated (FHA) protein
MHEVFDKEKPLDAKLVDEANDKEYALKEGKNVVGRKADISVENDPFISRKNCLIEVIKNSYHYDFVLTDDGSLAETGDPSTNGTFHNGNRLTKYDKVYLSNGDKIRIGHTELIFVCS